MKSKQQSHSPERWILRVHDTFASATQHMALPGTTCSETSHMFAVCKLFAKSFPDSSQTGNQIGGGDNEEMI